MKDACNNLGFQFMEGQKRYLWYGKWVGNQPLPDGISESLGKMDHAIHVPAAVFEIGVVKKGNGYILLWDSCPNSFAYDHIWLLWHNHGIETLKLCSISATSV